MEKFKKVIELRGGLIGNNKYDDFIHFFNKTSIRLG
jgi:hypothetical protein